MPILCEPAAGAEELMRHLGSEVRAADDLGATAQLLDSDPAETLVVIGPQARTDEALGFASALRMVRPAVGVILVRDQADVALLNQALQSGVREVVQSDDHAALAAACRRSRDVSWRILAATSTTEHTGPKTDGKVITVFTAKGGSAWWTSTWRPATWRSACCSTRSGPWRTRFPCPGTWTPPGPRRC